ncbi:MAG TPA: hypothetical protein VGW77_27580 [Candidatus Binatia bacterium]|jgi:hypothetical protein|nr:hypothetical protein [Candidatus Binatia bacterium]
MKRYYNSNLNVEKEKLNTLGAEPRGSELVDWKSTLVPVIPAQAGIQAVFELELKTNLDAGVRRHDELLLRLKARDLDDPRERGN